MEKDHTWGDAICLKYLADVVRRPIQVYAFDQLTKRIYEDGMQKPQDGSLSSVVPLVLWYNGASHYELVCTDWLEQWGRAILHWTGILSTQQPEVQPQIEQVVTIEVCE